MRICNRHATFAVLFLSSIAVSGCDRTSGVQRPSAQSFPNPGPTRLTVRVTSGTTFILEDCACSLLGVKESHDATLREKANRFTQQYFDNVGHFGVTNADIPLYDSKGRCLVWIVGRENQETVTLNTALVRAGLAEVNLSEHADYSFTAETKEDTFVVDWASELNQAMNEATPNVSKAVAPP